MPRPKRKKVRKILIILANPKGTLPLRLAEELRLIYESLIKSSGRELFIIQVAFAFTTQDLLRNLIEYQPDIVHFAGHSSRTDGIICNDEASAMTSIPITALTNLFKRLRHPVQCVVLNSCESLDQGKGLAGCVDYVVAMQSAISDLAALSFAGGFYTALFAGEDYATCHQLGVSQVELRNIPEHLTPVLLVNTALTAKIKSPVITSPDSRVSGKSSRTKRNVVKSKKAATPAPQINLGRRAVLGLGVTSLVASISGWELRAAIPPYPLDGIYKQQHMQPSKVLGDTGFSLKADSCTLLVWRDARGYRLREITSVRITLNCLSNQVIGGYVNTWEWEEVIRLSRYKVKTQAHNNIDRGLLSEITFDKFADPRYAQNFVKAQKLINQEYGKEATAIWTLSESGILRKDIDYQNGNPPPPPDYFEKLGNNSGYQ